MTILSCPQCAHRLKVPPHAAKVRVRCPHCRELVPESLASATPPVAGDETANLPPPDSQVTSALPAAANTEDPYATHAQAGAGIMPSPPNWPTIPGYEVLEVLGRGGMGVVYKARHLRLKRLVALKMILHADHAGTQEHERFRIEAEAVAQLQHANIVQIHEVGEHRGCPFFSLEFCPGGSLAASLGGNPLPAKDAAAMVGTLARAMHAAHQKGIIHRDLKPANVLLAEDGALKITDFGLAKRLDEQGQTATGAVMGTPSYMAPEQASGETRAIGPGADVYALGAVLYELLTGRPPFRAATPLETVNQVTSEEPVPPSQLQRRLPRDLETVCLKCLQKQPGRRYASAEALADDLDRYQAGEPIRARPVGRLERAWRWCRRYPAVAALLGLALVFGATMAGLFAQAAALRENEAEQRKLAETAWDEAETRKRALEAEQKQSTNLLYATRINLAYREWQAANPFRARQLLDECPHELRGWEWEFLNDLFEGRQLALRGHGKPLRGVGLTPDGNRAITIANDQTVRVWDTQTGVELRSFPVQAHLLAISPDGRRVAVAVEHSVHLYDLASGRRLAGTDLGEPACGLGFVRGGTELALATLGGEVRIVDANQGTERTRLARKLTFDPRTRGLLAMGIGVAFSPDGRHLAQGGESKVRVWDAATGETVLDATAHLKLVGQVAFSPDGRRLASPGGEGDVRVWDLDSKQTILYLRGHESAVHTVAFSPDGQWLVSGSKDTTVRIWDATTGEARQTLRGHLSEVNGVAFASGDRVASASLDATARVWNVSEQVVLGQHFSAFFERQKRAVPSGRGKHEGITLRGHLVGVEGFALSPDGRLAASAASGDDTQGQPVILWDLVGHRELHRLTVTRDRFYRLAFSPDGRRLAVGCGGGAKNQPAELYLFEAATGRRLWQHTGPPCIEIFPGFAPDGTRLAAVASALPGDNFLLVWETEQGTEQLRQKLSGLHIRASYDPEGKWLVTGGVNTGQVEVYDAVTGALVRQWSTGSTTLTDVVCGRGGLVATALGVRSTAIKLYDLSNGQSRATLEGHTGMVLALAFSADGRRLLSGGGDFTVRLWHTGSGRELLTLREHRDVPLAVAWSADGSRIGSAGQDGMVKIWTVATTAAPRTDDWPLLYRADFATDGPSRDWDTKDNSPWEVRGGALHGRQVLLKYQGTEFPIATAGLKGVELPRTVEVRFAYRSVRPLTMGVSLVDPRGERQYIPLVCDGPQPFGSAGAFLLQITEGQKMSLVGVERPLQTPVGPWRQVRVVREPERLRLVVDGREVLSERLPDVELTGLAVQGSWGAAGEEIAFKDLEIRAPAAAVADQQVRSRVRQLYEKVLLPAEVRRQLAEDKDLTAADRQLVERLTRGLVADPVRLEEASRKVTSQPEAVGADYGLALKQAEAAQRAEPDKPEYLGTLARAQYRAGLFAQALATMQRALEATRDARGAGYPYQYAVLALAQHRLGHTDQALVALGQLRDLLLGDHWSADSEARLVLAETEKVLGAQAPSTNDDEAIKRLLARSEQDGWNRHDLAAFLVPFAADVRVRLGREEKPGPYDVTLDRRQLEDVRRLDFQGPPSAPEVMNSYEGLHVEVRGAEAEQRGRVTVHFGPDRYQVYGQVYRLRRTPQGWRIVEHHSWFLAERESGRRSARDAAYLAAQDATVARLAASDDLEARVTALREARRPTEAYALARRATEQKPNDAGAWMCRGDLAHDVGAVADARACFRRALQLDPDVALPWYMTRQRLVFRAHESQVFGVGFHPDGQRVFSGGHDKLGRLWRAATGQEIRQFAGSEGSVWTADLSPDGRIAATASTALRLWDVESGRLLQVGAGHTAMVHRLAFSADGTRVVTASADRTARVWDVATGRLLLTLNGHTDSVLGAVFSPDGRLIATASHDKTAKIWDAATGAEVRTLTGHTAMLKRAAFSPDGRRLATTGGDLTTRIWEVSSGRELQQLQGHEKLIEVVLYSPDGRLLATADMSGIIRVWDAHTGAKRQLLRGHDGWIFALAFRGDSQVLASAAEDGVILWDVSAEPAEEAGPPGPAAPG